MAPNQRRLAAIVVADVVGYTRLMERDDAGTHSRLREIRERLVEPKMAEVGGRIVSTAGDGLLLEFGSAAAALRFAIDLQRAMEAINHSLAADDRIDLRMGINLADVIVDGDDIAGDGVNVAARLEALAEPGGIFVSSGVREQVHGDIGARFIDIGEHSVKNHSRPIHVYRVEFGSPSAFASASLVRPVPTTRWARLAAVTAAFAVAATAVGYVFLAPTTTLASASRPPVASVAVLPFTPAWGSGDRADFAHRFTQDVTMALQHVMRPVRVVSYGLAAKHGEGYLDPRSAGNALKVRYLVEGTVSESNGFDVVGVRLIDASDGALLWSERITLSQSNDAEGSHEVAIAQLANGLRPAIGAAEARRAAMVPAWSSSPMDLVFRANDAWNRDHSLEGTFAARKAYEDALRLDPGFSPALIGLGYTYQMQLAKASDPGVDRQGVVKQMDEVSSRAIRANPDDPGAWVLRGDALALQWRWDGAFEANGQALKLDPYLVGALHSRASLLIRTGQPDKALELLERAIELSPRGLDLHTSLVYRCRAMLAVGDFVAAIGACERALALGGSWWYPHLLLVAAYTLAGDTGNAAIERDRLFENQPGMSIARFKAHGASNDPVYLRQTEANIVGGLRMAGVPEE